MAPRCRGCGAPIVFATTDAGRAIPLDPEPGTAPYANVAVTRDARGRLLARVLTKAGSAPARPWEVLYVPHFVTCTSLRSLRSRQGER